MRLMKILIVTGLIALMLAACGQERTQGSFVGQVAGTDAFVAVVTDGELVIGYVCDGQGIGEWFQGRVADGVLTSARGARLALEVAKEGVSGTFTAVSGSSHSFTTEVATGSAGLYRLPETVVDDETYKGGWIVLPNGDQRGELTTSDGSGCAATNGCPRLGIARQPSPAQPPDPKVVLPNGAETEVPPVETDDLSALLNSAIAGSKGN